MQERTYAVYWSEGSGHRFAGRLAVTTACAELVGRGEDGAASQVRIFFEDILGVRYNGGRLLIRPRTGVPVEIGSVDGPGALHEAASRLRAFAAAA